MKLLVTGEDWLEAQDYDFYSDVSCYYYNDGKGNVYQVKDFDEEYDKLLDDFENKRLEIHEDKIEQKWVVVGDVYDKFIKALNK